MEYTTILLWILFLWVFLQIFISVKKHFAGKLPPGPFPLPIIGSLFKLGDKPHKSLAQLAKVHGSLMTIKLGSVTTIVVSSASMAKEVLQTYDQQFSGRTVPHAVRILNYHEASMVWSRPSLQWRSLRKLCATQIFTTQRLNENEGIRLMKVKDLISFIHGSSKSRHAVNIGQAVFSTTLNIISNTIFSVDLAQFNSESAQDFKAVVWGILEEVGKPNLADYFPLLRPFDPQGVRRRTASYFEKLDSHFDTLIDQRMQSNKEQNVSNDDLLDTVLQYTKENGSKLRRLDITSLLKDLFIAGTDTSTGTLEWAMTELLRNPDIMAKARLELIETIDKDKLIEESDIGRLPYIQAVVKETLRLHPPAPLLVPHRAETDVEICGFSVPRHAQVFINAWAIGRDPETWINPTAFLPDRFLGSKVDFRGRNFEFIPFGAGRRMCPGLPLADRMVHLMLASLLHAFDWELEDGMMSEDINMEENFGLTLQKAKPLYAIPIEA